MSANEALASHHDSGSLSNHSIPRASLLMLTAVVGLGGSVHNSTAPKERVPLLTTAAQASESRRPKKAPTAEEIANYHTKLLKHRGITPLRTYRWSSKGGVKTDYRVSFIDPYLCSGEVIAEPGKGIVRKDLLPLIGKDNVAKYGRNYEVVASGIFFNSNKFLVQGSGIYKPVSGGFSTNSKFYYSTSEELRRRIGNRYFIAINDRHEFEVEKESKFRNYKTGHPKVTEAQLKKRYPNFFISGALGVSFSDPMISRAVYSSDPHHAQKPFLTRVNETNSRFEGLSASRGLHAYKNRPRAAIGLIKIKAVTLAVLFYEGEGASPDRGTTLFKFTRDFAAFVNRIKDARPLNLLYLDDHTSPALLAQNLKPEDNAYPTRKLSNLMAFWRRDIPGKG